MTALDYHRWAAPQHEALDRLLAQLRADFIKRLHDEWAEMQMHQSKPPGH